MLRRHSSRCAASPPPLQGGLLSVPAVAATKAKPAARKAPAKKSASKKGKAAEAAKQDSTATGTGRYKHKCGTAAIRKESKKRPERLGII